MMQTRKNGETLISDSILDPQFFFVSFTSTGKTLCLYNYHPSIIL